MFASRVDHSIIVHTKEAIVPTAGMQEEEIHVGFVVGCPASERFSFFCEAVSYTHLTLPTKA